MYCRSKNNTLNLFQPNLVEKLGHFKKIFPLQANFKNVKFFPIERSFFAMDHETIGCPRTKLQTQGRTVGSLST